MQPRITVIEETKLIGVRTKMSFANNKTMALWQSFMPRRMEVSAAIGCDLYSVELYPDVAFFSDFDPGREFEKWAAVRVTDFNQIPQGMDTLIIPAGEYAVFPYKGKPSEARGTYQFIYGTWMPGSPYQLDDRPHMALMGEKYKGEHPESEEEFWIPVRHGQV
jgi:AraC family transcriptional regulator